MGVRVADCLPLLVADPVTGAVAAIHAGWRGVEAGVVRAGLDLLLSFPGVRTGNLLAAIFPHIRPCCFEVGPEVADAVAPGRPDLLRPGPEGRPLLDLRGAVVSLLVEGGLDRDSIDAEAPCTACRTDLLYSYRREGRAAGRLLAVAGLRAAAPERLAFSDDQH